MDHDRAGCTAARGRGAANLRSSGGAPGRGPRRVEGPEDPAGRGGVLRTFQAAVWANTRICGQDLVDEIRRMKADSDVPMRTMGSPSLARQLLSAGLVDRLRLMVFPLIAGDSGREAFFADMSSADLELV